MRHFLVGTRYLILIPILGLSVAAICFFVFGGFGLLQLLFEMATNYSEVNAHTAASGPGVIIFEVVEYVHTFLVGTVLYITAIGLYQLFIKEIDFVGWLKIDSVEELETDLIGVTVVVLAVNFMGAVFAGKTEDLLSFGAGIALPIAALGLFVGLRAWATRSGKSEKSTKAFAQKENE